MKRIILKSDHIYTGLDGAETSGCVVVEGNRILAVCRDGEGRNYETSGAEIYDFRDHCVMPGFCDFHVHLVNSATIERDGDLRLCQSEEEAARLLFEIHRDREREPIILGGAWDEILWGNARPPRKETLDRYFPDTPVFLLNKECHGAWVNSKMLEQCGITAKTPDPPGGRIERDAAGNPNGHLHEAAVFQVQDLIFAAMSDADVAGYARAFIRSANRFGITALGDVVGVAGIRPEAYRYLEEKGELNARIYFSVEFDRPVPQVAELQAQYSGGMVKCNGVKAFIDGTPLGHTGYMLEDYADQPGEWGAPAIPPESFRAKVEAFHREGIQVRVHACGDAGVRLCLDAFAAAQRKHGKGDVRHCIEHIEAASPVDLPRFGELGVIASMQPEHLPKYVFEEHPFHQILGPERMKYAWPMNSILQGGGVLAFGTDSPVAPLNPCRGIFRAVTRLTNYGTPQGGWNPGERISVQDAIRAYTLGGAYASRREAEVGTLTPGKLADIAVLERSILPAAEDLETMRNMEALMTIVDGRIVYQK